MGRKLRHGFLAYDRSLEDELQASRFCNVVTAAVVGAGATVYAASESSKASKRATNAAKQSADAQNAIAQRQVDMAEQQYQRYLDVYGPAEEAYVDQAMGYGSQGNQELAATKAGADVAAVQGGAKKRFEQNLASLGVNPNDQKYVNTMADMELQGAAARAGAQTGARDKVRDVGMGMLKDVASLGKGIPSSTASMLSSASSTMGNAATGLNSALNSQATSWNNTTAGLGGLTGKIIGSDQFKNWWDQQSFGFGSTPNAPTSNPYPSDWAPPPSYGAYQP